MSQLTTEQTKEYLDIVVNLETSVYTLENIMKKIQTKIKSCQYSIEKNTPSSGKAMPVEFNEKEPEKPNKDKQAFVGKAMAVSLIGFLVCLVIGGILLIAGAEVGIIFLGIAVIAAIYNFVFLIPTNVKQTRLEAEYAQYLKRKEMAKAQKAKANKQIEQRQTANRDLEKLKVEEAGIKKVLLSTETILSNLYNEGYVYEKYRNMAAVCTILDYLKSGRCSELEGANGAYNLYESELRQNLIISKLDTVIKKLNQIQNNQYLLYTEIQKSNQMASAILSRLDSIDSTLGRIEHQTRVIAICSEITAYNTTAANYLARSN